MSKKQKVIITVTAIIAAAIILYMFISMYFHSHYFLRTTMNGIDCGGYSVEELEQAVAQEVAGYELTIKERGGKKETITAEQLKLVPEFDGSLDRLMEQQNRFAWIRSLWSPASLQADTVVTCENLDQLVKKLDCMDPDDQVQPVSASISGYGKDGYTVIPEEKGTVIEYEKLLDAVEHAVNNLQEELDLEEAGCYAVPEYTADSEEIQKALAMANGYVSTQVMYDFSPETEVLDGVAIHNWVTVNGLDVSLNEEAVVEYVDELARKYNTVFRKHTLDTSYGTPVEISGGDYGWWIDKEAEIAALLENIRAGETIKREPVYKQRAAGRGEHDYGNTYVEINLTAQHLFMYKDGALLVESDFVSGNVSKGNGTPAGAYSITYTERNATLKGENYASDVSYWMPFNNNIGMHDASWRGSFGGTYYMRNGSHGCINLPYSAAQTIFENIKKGDPVLVYELPGTGPAYVEETPAEENSDAAIELISAIGDVTLASGEAISAARAQYDILTEEAKARVVNYDVLVNSEIIYAQLVQAQAAEAQAQAAAEAQAAEAQAAAEAQQEERQPTDTGQE